MEILFLVLVLAFGLLLRLAFITKEGTDLYVHFWLIKKQKGRKWVNYEVEDSIVKGVRAYPVLNHLLVSKLPEKYWITAGKVLNASYDIITAVLVYITARFVNLEGGFYYSVAGISLPLICTFVFLTLPVLLPSSARMRTIGGRSMGLLFVSLYFVSLGAGYLIHPVYFFPSVIFGLLAILSSKFGFQTILLFSFFLAFIKLSVIPLIITTILIIIAYTFPKLGAWTIIKHWWDHRIWFFNNYEKCTASAGRNNIKDILFLPVYLFRDRKKFIMQCYFKITPLMALRVVPVVVFLIIIRFFYPGIWSIIQSNSYLLFSWDITVASIFSFILTSIYVFKGMGEAERYFEYSSLFYSIIFPFIIFNISKSREDILFSVLLLQLVIILSHLLVINYNKLVDSETMIPKNMKEAVEWIRNNVRKSNILTVPCKLSVVLSSNADKDNLNKFYFRFIMTKRGGLDYFEEDTGGYHYSPVNGLMRSNEVFSLTPYEMKRKYKADYIVVEKKYFEGLKKTLGKQGIKFLKNPVFENGNFLIYKL